MISYIKKWFPNPEAENLNTGIMNHKFEDPLDQHILDCFYSIEDSIENIKLVSHEFVTNYDQICMADYEQDRSSKKKKKDKTVYMRESRLGELILTFECDISKEPVVRDEYDKWVDYVVTKIKDPEVIKNPKVLRYTIKELIPIADEEDGSYFLKGVRQVPQYQISETTTYNTTKYLVLKSFLGIKLGKRKVEAHDNHGEYYILTGWSCNHMTWMMPVMIFYLAEYGWNDTLNFFMVDDYIELVQPDSFSPTHLYFEVTESLYLKVSEVAFRIAYVQGILGSLIDVIDYNSSLEDIMDRDYWIKRISATKKKLNPDSYYELGKRDQVLFKRTIDRGSRKFYRLTDHNKRTVFHAIRWMIQEYNILRARDNLDLSFKCLRGNLCIAQLVTVMLSLKIKKFIHTKANTPEKLKAKYDGLFKFKGTEVNSKVSNSNIVKNDDVVNDLNDVYSRFAATTKGPNASGDKNPQNITMRQRGLHPSHLGKIGISECSSSDPGRTANICPLSETDGLFFKNTPPEPEEFGYNFKEELGMLTEWKNKDGDTILTFSDPIKFNNILDMMDEFKIQVIGTNDDSID